MRIFGMNRLRVQATKKATRPSAARPKLRVTRKCPQRKPSLELALWTSTSLSIRDGSDRRLASCFQVKR